MDTPDQWSKGRELSLFVIKELEALINAQVEEENSEPPPPAPASEKPPVRDPITDRELPPHGENQGASP